MPKAMELDENDELIFEVLSERPPDAIVATGINDGSRASMLSIFYHKDTTFVSAGGEAFNTEPWKFDGTFTKEVVLSEYMAAPPSPSEVMIQLGINPEEWEALPDKVKEYLITNLQR